jgi:thiol-disulfide isomerase/thioredoxin
VIRRVLVLALVALMTVTACGRDLPPVVGTTVVAPTDREPAPDIAGTTLDGTTLDLADYRGRVVVLNDWASWCAPCRDEAPALAALSKSTDPAEVAVVGLNVTDEAAAARDFASSVGMTYPSIVDPDGALLRTIPGVPPSSLPSTVVLDREGRIAARIIGGASTAGLSAIVEQIAAEGPGSSPSAPSE